MWFLLALLLALSGPVSAQEPEPIRVGSSALAFSLKAMNSDQAEAMVKQEMVTLGELVGVSPSYPAKAVLIYFFDRAGGGEGLRPLNAVARRFRNDGVRIVAISVDPRPEVVEWVSSLKLDYPVLDDRHRVVGSRYRVKDLPMVLLVDSDGMIHSAGSPAMQELETVVDSQIRALLSQ